MRVILLSGRKQSGKNTVADMIRQMLGEIYCVNVAFADPLKEMCKEAFRPLIGTLNREFSDMQYIKLRDEKTVPAHRYHTADHNWYENKNDITRHILQIVGTDIVRKIQPNYWIDQTIIKLGTYKRKWATISDWRFPNEFNAVEAAFKHAVSIRVTNNRVDKRADTHISETALDNYAFDYTIENNHSISELREKVQQVVYELIEEDMP